MAKNQNVEQQLEALTGEVEKRNQSFSEGGVEKEPKHEKEHLHDVIGEKLYGPGGTQQPHGQARHQDLPSTHGDEPPSYNLPELHDKVQELVTYAFEHDLEGAIKKVQETQDAALIDAFHDALVDELHDHLVNTGKLESL